MYPLVINNGKWTILYILKEPFPLKHPFIISSGCLWMFHCHVWLPKGNNMQYTSVNYSNQHHSPLSPLPPETRWECCLVRTSVRYCQVELKLMTCSLHLKSEKSNFQSPMTKWFKWHAPGDRIYLRFLRFGKWEAVLELSTTMTTIQRSWKHGCA